MDKHSQLARQQFQLLLEKSNKRFGKLRELQTRGDYSWGAAQALFHRTFDSFSRLWQFQLNNRAALLETGLQRAELGGIANKIGQLYYNYYLRSGDTGALLESYTFYDAVHTRQYFASPAGDPAAAARQMRFYARFVVVCLFLHRREEAMQLIQELQATVSSYVLQYSPPDAPDWQLVVNEVAALMAADQLAMPLPRCLGSLEVPYTPPLRCRCTDPAAACAPHRPRLLEAILVSYRPRQIKVAELPLELYRMTQALEWQQAQSGQTQPAGAAGGHPATIAAATGGCGSVAAGQGSGHCEGAGAASLSCTDPVPTRKSIEAHSLSQAPVVVSSTGNPPGVLFGAGTGHPTGPSTPSPATWSRGGPAPPSGCSPPRQLLHRPTAQRLLAALLAVTAGVDPAVAGEQFVLLYISADAAPTPPSQPPAPLRPSPQLSADGSHLLPPLESRVALTSPMSPCRQLLLCPPPPTQHHQHKAHTAAVTAVVPPQTQPHPSQQPHPPRPSQPSPLIQSPTRASTAVTAATADGLLSPEELLIVTRRRMLLVVDSDMGADFAKLQGRERGFPLLCLKSPPWQALTPGPEPSRYGSLTAMALSCPAQAMCVLVGQTDPQPEALQKLQEVLDDVLLQLGRQMAEQLAATATHTTHGSVVPPPLTPPPSAAEAQDAEGGVLSAEGGVEGDGPKPSVAITTATTTGGLVDVRAVPPGALGALPAYAAWAPAFDDCLSRRLLLHFALYRACVHMHPRRNADPEMAPSCFPPLPPAADPTNLLLRRGLQRAAEVLGRPGVFAGSGLGQ